MVTKGFWRKNIISKANKYNLLLTFQLQNNHATTNTSLLVLTSSTALLSCRNALAGHSYNPNAVCKTLVLNYISSLKHNHLLEISAISQHFKIIEYRIKLDRSTQIKTNMQNLLDKEIVPESNALFGIFRFYEHSY